MQYRTLRKIYLLFFKKPLFVDGVEIKVASNSKCREILTTKDTKSTKIFCIRLFLRALRGKNLLKCRHAIGALKIAKKLLLLETKTASIDTISGLIQYAKELSE